MTKLDADTLLTTVDENAPIDAGGFEDRIVTAARQWCDFAYKGRFEKAADEVWALMDELSQIIDIDEHGGVTEVAHAILDVAEESGELGETQLGEMADLREWIDQNGGMYNFRRSLK
jgi:hypothetical protein